MTQLHSFTDIVTHESGVSISAKPLLDISWLRHASTTRQFSSPDSDRRQELYKVQEHLGVANGYLVCGQQQHTCNVATVTPDILKSVTEKFHCFQETDALICPVPEVTIAIMTADCAPIFLVDTRNKVIALAHAGWKGTFSRIGSKTVESMASEGSSPADIIAWVGPMAGGCCYEVSPELIEKFRIEFTNWPIESISKVRHLDLVDINCRQLEAAGLSPENIHRSNLCTIHDNDRFYSYRADNGTHGRIISAMAMTF